MKSYVYIYLDSRKKGIFCYDDLTFDHEPFYVGKGVGDRLRYHLNEKKIVNKFKTGKINKIKECGLQPIILIINENLSDDYAIEIEKNIIAKIGRYPNGPLTNLTDGGDGTLGLIRSDESINKQKNSISLNDRWYEKMKSKEFSEKMSNIKKEFYLIQENRKAVAKKQTGSGNSMYGKNSSKKQKIAVSLAHKEGRITLSEEGRKNIIESGKRRKGTKNKKRRKDVIIYILSDRDNSKFLVYGSSKLQELCKEKKIQVNVLKRNLDKVIDENDVIGNKIFSRNTIGWKLERKKD